MMLVCVLYDASGMELARSVLAHNCWCLIFAFHRTGTVAYFEVQDGDRDAANAHTRVRVDLAHPRQTGIIGDTLQIRLPDSVEAAYRLGGRDAVIHSLQQLAGEVRL